MCWLHGSKACGLGLLWGLLSLLGSLMFVCMCVLPVRHQSRATTAATASCTSQH
jgi:hypothetical protein